jgi:hypothetical protein
LFSLYLPFFFSSLFVFLFQARGSVSTSSVRSLSQVKVKV